MKGGDHSEYVTVDRRIKKILYKRCEFVDWIELAQGRTKLLALLNTVISLRFHEGQGISRLA
jgi:hypothetical protein